MQVSLLKLKNIVKKLEKGAKGVALSKIGIEFWLMRSEGEEILLELKHVGQFSVTPDVAFSFKVEGVA